MRPDLDDLIGTDIEPGERARLEGVHELLVAAGPPPELPQNRPVELPRRRRGALLAIAAALAIAAFAMGAALVDSGRSVDFVVPMHATAAVPGASASLTVFDLDDAGNWPMELTVAALTPRAGDLRFQLWLTRKGERGGAVRRFRHGRRRIGCRPDERAVPLRRVRRLGRRRGRLRDSTSHDVSTPGSSAIVGAMSQYEDFMRHVLDHGRAKTDRTGTGTSSVFGYQMRFDLPKAFRW